MAIAANITVNVEELVESLRKEIAQHLDLPSDWECKRISSSMIRLSWSVYNPSILVTERGVFVQGAAALPPGFPAAFAYAEAQHARLRAEYGRDLPPSPSLREAENKV